MDIFSQSQLFKELRVTQVLDEGILTASVENRNSLPNGCDVFFS